MYIAVMRYKTNTRYIPADKVCVFDTSDCSAELVHYFDLKKSGVVLLNQERLRIKSVSIALCLRSHNFDYVQYNYEGLRVGERYIKRGFRDSFLCFNDKITNLSVHYVLAYPFLFRDWIVMRFVYIKNKKEGIEGGVSWYTVAVCGDKVEWWDENLTDCSDKKLAVLVDTIKEV